MVGDYIGIRRLLHLSKFFFALSRGDLGLIKRAKRTGGGQEDENNDDDANDARYFFYPTAPLLY